MTVPEEPTRASRRLREEVSRHARRVQAARRRRLHRTVSLSVGLLLVGTVVARAGESTGLAPARPLDAPAAAAMTPSITSPSSSLAATPASQARVDTPTPPTASSTPKPAATTWAAVRVTDPGRGTIAVLSVPQGAVRSSGRTVRYTVEAEDGLGVDLAEFAASVQRTLLDPRGWQGVDGVRFVNVTPEQERAGTRPDIRVTLASPTTTNRLCAPQNTGLQKVSCSNNGRAVINLFRWMSGAQTYGTDLSDYRIYVINHEVGHGLGHGHVGCPQPGAKAPIMVQQTKFLLGCTAWPYPARS